MGRVVVETAIATSPEMFTRIQTALADVKSSARVLSMMLTEDASLKLEDGFRVDAMEVAPKEAKEAAPE